MNDKKKRQILVNLFKMFIHALAFIIFMCGFVPRYDGMQSATRTLAVVIGSYTFMSVWMTQVYGKIEIGQKKTRPLFHTMALNLFITNAVAFFAVIVMTINNQRVSFWEDFSAVVIVYIVQLIVVRVLIGFANSLYFKNYTAEKTIVIYNDERYLTKVDRFLTRHKRQYEVLGYYSDYDVNDLNLLEISHVFLLDVDFEYLKKVGLRSTMLDVNIYYNASVGSLPFVSGDVFMVDDIIFFQHRSKKITITQEFFKRAIDILVSGLALLLASPLMIVFAIAIKLEDGGPVFFSQDRITKDGKLFKIHKFRSMKVNAGEAPATVDDDRITKVGHILRKIRMDELPQFINILKGEMSVVGPRPESLAVTQEVLKHLPEFTLRYKVKAGLTGTAQIFGKYNTLHRDKLLMDLYYIENFSTLNDISLMFQTLFVFLKKDSTEGFEEEII